MLSQCGLATEQINEAISSMYRQDVWMKRDVANDVGNKGLSFVETYGRLARYAFDNSKALWALMPKGHVVHHLFSDLFEAADEWVINPLVFAVQTSTLCGQQHINDHVWHNLYVLMKALPTYGEIFSS